jgi:hypothetical protein
LIIVGGVDSRLRGNDRTRLSAVRSLGWLAPRPANCHCRKAYCVDFLDNQLHLHSVVSANSGKIAEGQRSWTRGRDTGLGAQISFGAHTVSSTHRWPKNSVASVLSVAKKNVLIRVHSWLIFLCLSIRSPNGIGTKADVFCAFLRPNISVKSVKSVADFS